MSETSVEFLKFRFRYKVMGDCWLSEPGMRPTFAELAEKIGEELQEGEQEVRDSFGWHHDFFCL